MTYEQYWEGDPYLTVVYREVDTRRQVEMNQYSWLIGKYVHEAVFSVIHNAFAKKGTKPVWYPKEPYRITPQTEEEKKAAAEAERQKAINSFNAWKKAWDRSHG